MKLEPVAPLEQLPDGEGFLFRSGAHQIAVFRAGETAHAIDNVCPHAGASLADGYTEGNTVSCPWHAWEFDCQTGKCLSVEGMDVETYRVVIEEGVVKVEIPD